MSSRISNRSMIDHHCHAVVARDLTPDEFEGMISESFAPAPLGTSHWDKPVGLAIRRWCAPVLDLPKFASSDDYVARRLELGASEVNSRFLKQSGITSYVVDTGNRPGILCSYEELGAVADMPAFEVVRMESIAEEVMRQGCDAKAYANTFEAAVEAALHERVVGLKTIVAYRSTLKIDQTAPSRADIEAAASRWLKEIEETGNVRIGDEVLERHILWFGADLARDKGLPIQFHIGLGDADVELNACDPSHLTGYFRAVEPWGVPMTLLHCYPFHREAGMIAENFPNIYFDVGFVQNWAGPSYRNMMSEALEMAPFTKQLFSTDAFGLSELFYLGTKRFRDSLDSVLDHWIDLDECTPEYAEQIKTWISGENAERIYRLDAVAN